MNSVNTQLEELLIGKIACFLHDPLEKPWILKEEEHEKRAIKHFRELFEKYVSKVIISDEKSTKFKDKIRDADILAATIDRQIFTPFYYHRKKDLVKTSQLLVFFKNMFHPKYEMDVGWRPDKIKRKVEDDIIKPLSKILISIDDPVEAYNLTFLLLEILYINSGLPPNPADTRVPHHMVLDHNVATASIYNWVYSDYEGYLVRIDLGGIKDFISSSRKARDLWAASYMSSLIVWFALSPLIWSLGPDISVVPSMRFNPLYFTYALDKLRIYFEKNKNISNIVVNFIKNVYGIEIYGKDLDGLRRDELSRKLLDRIPLYPIQPAVMTLLLPKIDLIFEAIEYYTEKFKGVNSYLDKFILDLKDLIRKIKEEGNNDETTKVKKLFEELITLSWRNILKTIINTSKSIKEEGVIYKFVKRVITEIESFLEDWKVYDAPPFIVKIGVVNAQSGIKYLNDIANNLGIRSWKRLGYLLYYIMNELISEYTKVEYPARRTPYYKLKLSDYLENKYDDFRKRGEGIGFPIKSKRGFDYCTSCGEIPAVLILPIEENNEYEKVLKRIIQEYIDISKIIPFFSPGEKLCPYCLAKRVFSLENIYHQVLQMAFASRRLEPSKFTIPSTSDLSSMPFRDYMKEAVENLGVDSKVLGEMLYAYGCSDKKYIIDLLEHDGAELPYMFLGEVEWRKKWEEWSNKIRGEYYENRNYLMLNYQDTPGIYYAILNADGDRMGSLISGDLYNAIIKPKMFRCDNDKVNLEEEIGDVCKFYKEYINNVVENVNDKIRRLFLEIFDSIISEFGGKTHYIKSVDINDFRSLFDNIVKQIGNKYHEIPNEIIMDLVILLSFIVLKPSIRMGGFRFKPSLIPTLSYHTTISKSLMINAVQDISRISKAEGMVVYAGGDDLLALLPVFRFKELGTVLKDYRHKKQWINVDRNRIYGLEDIALRVANETRIIYSDGTMDILEEYYEEIRDDKESGVNDEKYKFGGFIRDTPRTSIQPRERKVKGFHKVGQNLYFPSLAYMGRSLVLAIVHYRYPLYLAVKCVSDILDNISKDSSIWEYGERLHQARDGFTLAYITSGGVAHITLPNKLYGNYVHHIDTYSYLTHALLKQVVDYILYGFLTHSFIRDGLDDPILSRRSPNDLINMNLYKKYIGYIVDRNLSNMIGDESRSKEIRRELKSDIYIKAWILDCIIRPCKHQYVDSKQNRLSHELEMYSMLNANLKNDSIFRRVLLATLYFLSGRRGFS